MTVLKKLCHFERQKEILYTMHSIPCTCIRFLFVPHRNDICNKTNFSSSALSHLLYGPRINQWLSPVFCWLLFGRCRFLACLPSFRAWFSQPFLLLFLNTLP